MADKLRSRTAMHLGLPVRCPGSGGGSEQGSHGSDRTHLEGQAQALGSWSCCRGQMWKSVKQALDLHEGGRWCGE